jgi:tetratricopeptide (TPR) repeat protein
MIFIGFGLIIGALADIILTAFRLGHLILILAGGLLVAVNLPGNRIRGLKGAIRTLVSLAVIAGAVFLLTGLGTSSQTKEQQFAINRSATDKLLTAEDYASLLRDQPENLDIRLMYAQSLISAGDFPGAIREAQAITRVDPEDSRAYLVIGDAWRGLNDPLREIYYYKIALGLDEKSVESQVKLAEAYGLTHSYDQAIKHYEAAKKLADSFEEETMVYESYLRFAQADVPSKSQEVP